MREDLHLGSTTIILLGTVHAHRESVELVRTTITALRPDHVAVELDPQQAEALESGATTIKICDLFKMGYRTAIISLLISYSNKKKAKKAGVPLMSDMLEAVRTAREIGAPVAFIDTAHVSFDLPFLEFVRFTLFLIKNSMREIRTDQKTLNTFIKELNRAAPSLSERDERERVMAENILKLLNLCGTIVVVLGMGHVEGVRRELLKQCSY